MDAYLKETVYLDNVRYYPDKKQVGMVQDYINLNYQEMAKLIYRRLNHDAIPSRVISLEECYHYATKVLSDLYERFPFHFQEDGIGDLSEIPVEDEYTPDGIWIMIMAEIYPRYQREHRPMIKFRVVVVQRGERTIPHVHIYFGKKGEDEQKIVYLCLHEAKYASKHKNRKQLTNQEIDALIEFFGTYQDGVATFTLGPDKKPIPANCWQHAVDIWFQSYDDRKNLFRHDEKGMFVMPDYTELKQY